MAIQENKTAAKCKLQSQRRGCAERFQIVLSRKRYNLLQLRTSVGLETFGNTVMVVLKYIAEPNNSLGDFACEKNGQWPGWKTDGRKNEERVTETAVD